MYVLFCYDPMSGTMTYLSGENYQETLVDYVLSKTDDSDWYAIYKYKEISFHFGSTQKAFTYELVKKIKGKKNSGAFPFSPMEYALKFENEYKWYFQAT